MPGISRCIQNALALVQESRLLLNHGHVGHAAVLFSLGVEEFGKAVLLRDGLDTGDSSPTIPSFYSHGDKLEAAQRYIPKEHLILRSGAFQRGAFQADAFDVGEVTDLSARVRGLYVNWDARNNRWIPEARTNADLLRTNIAEVERILGSYDRPLPVL